MIVVDARGGDSFAASREKHCQVAKTVGVSNVGGEKENLHCSPHVTAFDHALAPQASGMNFSLAFNLLILPGYLRLLRSQTRLTRWSHHVPRGCWILVL